MLVPQHRSPMVSGHSCTGDKPRITLSLRHSSGFSTFVLQDRVCFSLLCQLIPILRLAVTFSSGKPSNPPKLDFQAMHCSGLIGRLFLKKPCHLSCGGAHCLVPCVLCLIQGHYFAEKQEQREVVKPAFVSPGLSSHTGQGHLRG